MWAAGDAIAFPVKQGGLAAQQAVAAAQAIAARAGADVHPEPFRPVLRGVLLTGRGKAWLRKDLDSPEGEAERHALFWPPTKIAGRYLSPYLAELAESFGDERPAAIPSSSTSSATCPRPRTRCTSRVRRASGRRGPHGWSCAERRAERLAGEGVAGPIVIARPSASSADNGPARVGASRGVFTTSPRQTVSRNTPTSEWSTRLARPAHPKSWC